MSEPAAPIAAVPVTAEPMPLPAASEPSVQADADGSETAVWFGALLSALALVGLAGVAGIALRRRRKVHNLRDVKIERPVIDHNGLPLGATLAKPTAAETVEPVARLAVPVTTAAFVAPRPVTVSGGDSTLQANAGAAVPLPRERPASPEERRVLIERLAAAAADRANPFRTRKARLHRAKLIEQSIGRRFENGRSRIDLSQYPLNWPELSFSRPAAT